MIGVDVIDQRVAECTEFLTSIYANTESNLIFNIHTGTGFTVPTPTLSLYEMVNGSTTIKQYVEHSDEATCKAVYLSVATMAQKPRGKSRGGEADASELPAFFMDIDLSTGKHADIEAGLRLADTPDEILSVITEIGLPDPLVVHSGGGLQLWWPLERPYKIKDTNDRAEAKNGIIAFQQAIISAFAERGLKADKTADLARILRVPGTWNKKKSEAVAVRLVSNPRVEHDPGELLKILTGSRNPMPVITSKTGSKAKTKASITKHNAIGNAFANSTIEWAQILEPHGWSLVRTDTEADTGAEVAYWRHPDATYSHSATTNWHDSDCLWLFSSSTAFNSAQFYDKFEAFTILANGDLTQQAINKAEDEIKARKLVREVDLTERNDVGNANLLINTVKGEVLYSRDTERWKIWDGTKWITEDGNGTVKTKWIGIASTMPSTIGKDFLPNAHREYSLSAAGIRNMLYVSANDPRISTAEGSFDQNIYQLNTPAGVVDLRTGKLLDHQPEFMHQKITPISPDFKAKPAQWLNFVNETFQGDKDLMRYAQQAMGMALIGEVIEQVFLFAYGPTGSGKGTFFETVMSVLGTTDSGYARSTNSRMVMATRNEQHDEEIARLAGKRLVCMSELNEGDRFNEAKLKRLTGGDTLEARYMHQGSFTFKPTHLLCLFGNDRPVVSRGGGSIWRRVQVVPFKNRPKTDRKRFSASMVENEGGAILAWLIQGCVDFVNSGYQLKKPRAVVVETDEYASTEDMFGQFLDERCVIEADGMVSVKDMKDAYTDWCEDNSIPAKERLGPNQLGGRLTSLDYGPIERASTGTVRVYKGIRLMKLSKVNMNGVPVTDQADAG